MKNLASVLVILALGVFSAACITTRALAPSPARPPLEVPPVPPRVIEPAPTPPAPHVEPVGDLPAAPPATQAKPRPQRDPQKPEPKPAETATVEQPPVAPPVAPPATVPPLRIASTADAAQVERRIRDILSSANGLLSRVDYRRLNAERRKAYDQAKQFAEGAEAAIKDAKYEYALELADKAETMAKGLQS